MDEQIRTMLAWGYEIRIVPAQTKATDNPLEVNAYTVAALPSVVGKFQPQEWFGITDDLPQAIDTIYRQVEATKAETA